jgi:hypothetical protein
MNNPAPDSVLKLFALWFSPRWIQQWRRQPARRKDHPRGFYGRIFTLRVVLWYLIFQRLNFDSPLAAVVRNLRDGGADRLGPRRSPLSRKVKSSSTSAYSQARQRMPLDLLQAALAYLGRQMAALCGWAPEAPKQKPGPQERQRQLLDGSTLRMLAHPELKKAYPPARGRRGETDWSLMRILAGFCARTGAVFRLLENATSTGEQAMAWTLMERAEAFIIWIGDRNFGVWSVAAQARARRQDVLVRLTRARAGKLAGGRAQRSGEDRLVQWRPSRHDQAAPGTPREAITGRLIYVRLRRAGKGIDLWLFTTLEAADYPLELLVQWYGQRWQAELHFRSVKTQMRLAQLEVYSPEMARKELYAAILAYNLVRAVLWSAGERLESGAQTLSFNDARRVVLAWLLDWARRAGQACGRNERWAQSLLEEAGQQKLPKRKKPRPSQVRMVRRCASKWPVLKGSRAAAQKRYEPATKSS